MNRNEVKQLLGVLRMEWPDTIVNEERITAWSWAFEDIPPVAVEGAVKQWLKTGKFFPHPAELLELIATESTGIDSWEAAWKEVTDCRKKHGVYVGERWRNDAGKWSSQFITDAVRHVGGYEAICAVTYDDEPTMRAQFRNAYENARKAEVRREQIGNAVIQLPARAPKAVGE